MNGYKKTLNIKNACNKIINNSLTLVYNFDIYYTYTHMCVFAFKETLLKND